MSSVPAGSNSEPSSARTLTAVPSGGASGAPAEPGSNAGRVGRFEVRSVLGSGAAGRVYLAFDPDLHREVAVKVPLTPTLTDDFRERFLREARAAAGISHPNICPVYEVGTDGDRPYIVMALVSGPTLAKVVAVRGGPFPPEVAAAVVYRLAVALDAAHKKGIVHRDLKPGNVLVDPDRADVVVTDFGLARIADDARLTADGTVMGTPAYMAPEQASGDISAVGPQSDIYALGVILYQMLTGWLPFDGTAIEVMIRKSTFPVPPPSAVVPGLSPDLERICLTALTKDPAGRFASAADMADALAQTLPAGSDGREFLTQLAPAAVPTTDPAIAQPGLRSGSSNRTPTPTATDILTPPPALVPLVPYGPPPVGSPEPAPLPAASGGISPKKLALGGCGVLIAAVAVAFALQLKVRLQLTSDVLPGDPIVLDPAAPDDAPSVTPPSKLTPPVAPEPIPIGLLVTSAGPQSSSELVAADATMLAVDELNKAGGVLGRKINPIRADCQAESAVYAREAERLITEEKVVALFGCWRTPSRKAVRSVVEQRAGVLFYPLQYEGLEQSPRIVYLGPVPNQQVLPAVDYLVERLGKRRLFVVGSDYTFPRVSAEVVKDSLRYRKGLSKDGKPVVVGEAYLPILSRKVGPVVDAVRKAKPDAILNFISGPANVPFFDQINADPETADIPVTSFSLMGSELAALDKKNIAGDFMAGTEFPSAAADAGREFMTKFRERYGSDRTFSDAMAANYTGVHLWAKAVAAAGKTDPSAVLKAIRGMTFDGPVGTIKVDPDTQHTWLPCRIGRVRPDAGLETVYEAADLIRPEPFPPGRTMPEWDQFMNALYVGWGNRWQAAPPNRERE